MVTHASARIATIDAEAGSTHLAGCDAVPEPCQHGRSDAIAAGLRLGALRRCRVRRVMISILGTDEVERNEEWGEVRIGLVVVLRLGLGMG